MGWSFNKDWSDWDITVYEYEIENNKIRTRKVIIPYPDWSDWSDYELNQDTLKIKIEEQIRTYNKKTL